MEPKIKFGVVHCHTENSLKDSTLTPTRLITRAKELGAPAVTITDHGTLAGVFEFIRAAKENDVKAIPGVEAYVQEDGGIKRTHLLLLAKNYDGYKAISRAVTKSNEHYIGGYPCFTMSVIKEFFGEGSQGHGNVIATSACLGGVLASVILNNQTIQNEIDKLEAKATKYNNPNDPIYKGNLKLLAECSEKVKELMTKRDDLKKLAEKKYVLRQRALSRLSGDELKSAQKALDAEKAESEKAARQLSEVKSTLAKTKKNETSIKQACKDAEKSHEKWNYLNREINVLKKKLLSKETLHENTKMLAQEYNEIFGDGNFYIELQYHGLPEEAICMPALANIAKELNYPTVACNDVHMADGSLDCIKARHIVSCLRFNKFSPIREDESEYYIKTDEELIEWLCRILDEETVNKAMHGINEIVNKCNVEFPQETHFPCFVGGEDGETSEQRLRRLTEEGILHRYPNGEFKYRDRVEYELKIINQMHYTDYLCIVQDYLSYGRKLGTDVPEGVGYSIGPGRGSAAGSLVCYLIGITSVDPMPLNLLFERFLNPDRVSSPDIDADLSEEVRSRVLDYVKEKYGEEAVCCIMTKGTLAAKNAIKSVARIKADEKIDDSKRILDLGNALAKIIPNVPDVKLADYEAEMRAAFSDDEDAQDIVSEAKLVEGTAITYGMHAAGVIIADNGDVGEYIPLMWNDKKQQWLTQCDMVEAEMQAGLLKFDFLGLKNLDIISNTLRLIKQNTGVSIDIETVPQESAIYQNIFAKGNTNFVFQFESDGMKNLLKKFKPENLEHLVLLNAVYRPGPLQYADAICEAKSGKKKRDHICESAKEVLDLTYGFPVFQEQIMQLCNKVAGFSLGESDMIRRYMSKKKADKMAKYKPKFIDGLINNGAAPKAAEEFWNELMNFASYAFNKSHSAVYATIAYYTAWLKYHYPTEYMTSVMNYTDIKKLPKMVQECRELNVNVIPPDVNSSSNEFTGKDNRILFGLNNVKNVGVGADSIIREREENGVFRSFKDFLQRVHPKKNVCEALIDAGALDLWCSNRTAMKEVVSNLLDDAKKIEEKKAIVETETNEKKRANAEKKMLEYQERFNQTIIPISIPENKGMKLAKEKDYLGMYISGHPLEEYPEAKNLRTTTIAMANTDGVYVTVCGIVHDLRVTTRKSDGKPIAFFTLEDETGSIDVCCFTKKYAEFGKLLEEEAALAIEGKMNIEIVSNNNEEDAEETEDGETIKQLYVDAVKQIMPKQHKILISVFGLHRWIESIYQMVVPYSDHDGRQVVLYDSALGEFRETTLKVSADILSADIDDVEISEADF